MRGVVLSKAETPQELHQYVNELFAIGNNKQPATPKYSRSKTTTGYHSAPSATQCKYGHPHSKIHPVHDIAFRRLVMTVALPFESPQ